MTPEELKALLEQATRDIAAQKSANEALVVQIKALEERVGSDPESVTELQEEIADLRAKMKNPVSVISVDAKDGLREIARKSYNTFIKDCKSTNTLNFKDFVVNITDEVKTLGLVGDNDGSGTGTAATAVQEVLAMDLIEYGRELSPILGQIANRAGLTRDYRELVLSKYPVIADGIENVAGTDFPKTDTQEYGNVKTDVIKVMANAPITDEAFFGTTYNVYSDLVRLLGDQIGVTLAAKVLYGDSSDKNGRGILSSSRIDITDLTGESFKPSMGADARDHDHFPVIPTGVSGSLGTDSEAIQDLVENVVAALPTKYLGKAKWHMNRITKSTLSKVRDTQGRPVFKFTMIEGDVMRMNGYPVVLDDTLPNIAADSTPIIFGDLNRAFAMANGDIDYMQVNPYKQQGIRYIEYNKEMFTIMQASDAILVVAATANGAA